MNSISDHNYNSTGDIYAPPIYLKTISFDRYEICIELDESDRFLNILSIKESKDFLGSIRSSINSCTHNVEKYYQDEE